MTDTTSITDNEVELVGLALQGSNPNSLTIVSAVWTATDSDGNTDPNFVVATDTLTGTYTGVGGDDTTVTLSAEVTLSDGSLLDTGPATLVVGAVTTPLSVVIVFQTATPTGGS